MNGQNGVNMFLILLHSQLVVNSLVDMEVATPAELVGAVTSVADTLGNLMTMMLDPGAGGEAGGNNTDNSTEAGETDPCSKVAVIDKVIIIVNCENIFVDFCLLFNS